MEPNDATQFQFHFPAAAAAPPGASFSTPVSTLQSPDRTSSADTAPEITRRKRTSFAYRIREHVKMGPKFSETVKGKLSVGAKIIKQGGRENLFREVFGLTDGEKLLKASQCYLSTTAGPIAGILFVSTAKVGFCSERSISVPVHSSSSEGMIRTPYKVCIPMKKIKGANEGMNVENPSQRLIEIVTHDNFEFWFMGFVRYEKALMNLQRAISMLK